MKVVGCAKLGDLFNRFFRLGAFQDYARIREEQRVFQRNTRFIRCLAGTYIASSKWIVRAKKNVSCGLETCRERPKARKEEEEEERTW